MTFEIRLVVLQNGFAFGGSGTIGGAITYGCVEEVSRCTVSIGEHLLLDHCWQLVRPRLSTLAAGKCVVAAQRPRVDITGERITLTHSATCLVVISHFCRHILSVPSTRCERFLIKVFT